jgi:sulfite dehydrogenase
LRSGLLAGPLLAALCAPVAAAPQEPAAADPLAQGRQLFTAAATPPCALCHTLRDAGAQGTVGPVLDTLQPDAARVATVLRDGSGTMPSYRASLSPAQIEALALYVAAAVRKVP